MWVGGGGRVEMASVILERKIWMEEEAFSADGTGGGRANEWRKRNIRTTAGR